jgi:hypothetical protein
MLLSRFRYAVKKGNVAEFYATMAMDVQVAPAAVVV